MLAGKGAGIFSNLAEVAENTLQLTARYIPEPERHALHARRFSLYKDIYPTLIPLLRRLNGEKHER